MTTTTHLNALEKALEASNVDVEGADALWVASLRSIARKLDATETPSDRLLQMWQAESKRLQRRQVPTPAVGVQPSGRPDLRAVGESPLARLRREEANLAAGREKRAKATAARHARGDHSACIQTEAGLALCADGTVAGQ